MPLRKLLAYAAIYVLWGASFLAIREIVAPPGGQTPIPPFFAAGLRLSLAGALLLVWSRFSGPHPLSFRQLLSAFALGFIMFTCDYASLFWAEVRIPSGLTAVIFAMIPIWVCAGELVLRTQRATPLSLGGLVLGFAGVVVLTLRPGSVAHAGVHISALAIAVMMAGTLCWAMGTLWSRYLPLPRPHRANAGWQLFSGGLLLLVLSAAAGEFHRIPQASVLLSGRVVLSMIYLIFAASIVAYIAYIWLLAHDAPTRIASYAYVNPLFALIIGATLAGERLTPLQIAGAALILLGVFATLMGKQKAATPSPQPHPTNTAVTR